MLLMPLGFLGEAQAVVCRRSPETIVRCLVFNWGLGLACCVPALK